MDNGKWKIYDGKWKTEDKNYNGKWIRVQIFNE